MSFRFKLLKGNHRVSGPSDPVSGQRGEGRTYRQGEIFETDVELDKKFGTEKFKRLKNKLAANDPEEEEDDDDDGESDIGVPQDDGLDTMTDQELATFAKEAGVEIKGKKRETIIKLVRESLVNA